MKQSGLPLDIEGLRLILAYADSVPHLETLLLLWESQRQPWSVADVAARTYVPELHAKQVLEDLERKHLIVRTPAGGYALNDSPQHRETTRRITELYQHNLTRVATLLHAGASRALREFSRAFRISGEG